MFFSITQLLYINFININSGKKKDKFQDRFSSSNIELSRENLRFMNIARLKGAWD